MVEKITFSSDLKGNVWIDIGAYHFLLNIKASEFEEIFGKEIWEKCWVKK